MWSFDTTAPKKVFLLEGLPTTSFLTSFTKADLNREYKLFSTKILDPHKQIWPWFKKAERTEASTALSKSQSEKIIVGFLPPSSKETFLKLLAHRVLIFLPVSVPPVNEITGTSLCLTISSPIPAPLPWTIFITPGGTPAFIQILLKSLSIDKFN